jgi:hypothetical protein
LAFGGVRSECVPVAERAGWDKSLAVLAQENS